MTSEASESVRSKPNREMRTGRWARAQRLLETLSVKQHVFKPSERTIWTVVGKEGDFLIDYRPESEGNSYCSCDDFHFRVLSGKIPECYHLIGVREAVKNGLYATIEFLDEEYSDFVKGLVADLFSHFQ